MIAVLLVSPAFVNSPADRFGRQPDTVVLRMFLPLVPRRPPTRRAHRRFVFIVAMLEVAGAVVLTLQYTPSHLLPTGKTDTLWGFIVGVAAAAALAEFQWAAAARRDCASEAP